MKPFRARSRSRAWALQLLYAWEVSGRDSLSGYAASALRHRRVSPRYRPYLERLVAALDEHLEEIDALLQSYIPNWRLERLAAIDRNILRLGVTELCYIEDVPGKVAITEAIQLAERYGSDDSGAFVNGVLDSVYREAVVAG